MQNLKPNFKRFMPSRLPMPHNGTFSISDWDQFSSTHAYGHFLQTGAWGELKSNHDWRATWSCVFNPSGEMSGGGLILLRNLPIRLGKLAYMPRGPVADWDTPAQASKILTHVIGTAKKYGAISLIIEPGLMDLARDGHADEQLLRENGFVPNDFTVQPRRSIWVNLNAPEAEILAKMKQKTRYNIGLARRKGVTVREATVDDVPQFYQMMQVTSERDKFAVHSADYYRDFVRLFGQGGADVARLLVAEHSTLPGVLLAGAVVTAFAKMGTYVYGASANEHRELMPTYLLQWEAMRWCRARDCQTYDLWGVPDENEETLEAEFEKRHDGLWGVYRFKRGFGGQLVRQIGAWVKVLAPLRWRAFLLARKWRKQAE
jgi:lipid II:glycine glycyltransferase (peptidoglycan interpeptide bridge formation enzyme)